MEQYPAVAFIVRHGKPLVLALSLLPPVVIALVLHAAGFAWMWSVIALALLPLTYLIARSYVELVTIIADMLLPK
ncbi:MAG: hypothetical protein JWN13_3200 [Betaproteobacteria bacterium]|jgi:hypothetical protein|nr:hypothetical protein [Betaproteobacteria bacterium]